MNNKEYMQAEDECVLHDSIEENADTGFIQETKVSVEAKENTDYLLFGVEVVFPHRTTEKDAVNGVFAIDIKDLINYIKTNGRRVR